MLTPPSVLLWAILTGIFMCLLSPLPKWMQRPIRFSSRFASKWGYEKKAAAEIRLRQIPGHLPRGLFKRKGTDKALENALLYDIILRVAPKVHYVDLVNLSLVSKRVRATMFPIFEDNDKDRELRLNSCYGNTKSTCWICGIQICNECSGTRRCRVTSVSAHMELCQARCSKCFYSAINTLRRPCYCSDTRKSNWGSSFSYVNVDRLLCRDCYKMKDIDRLALREKHDRMIYANLTQQPLSCAQCTEALPPTGPLWWVCSKCLLECRCHDHPGWRRKPEV
ncbi:hypothetical protein OIDMADRAFT_15993 [Oidiodendron maius Zn]|uniref:F-box domain-containing protein n=1 Tax=Oidiodendron maius (strain Zn) TaxID=913774 RepID=A0A0C3D715_OIDMZ|nr:hypothetical protein OIDMADRAFT_15993 [Oidiodendron maius Zn]